MVRKNDWVLEYSKTKEEDGLGKAARVWNVVMIFDDLEEYEKAEERLREAIAGFEIAFEKIICIFRKINTVGRHCRGLLGTGTRPSSSCCTRLLCNYLFYIIYFFITLMQRGSGGVNFIYKLHDF